MKIVNYNTLAKAILNQEDFKNYNNTISGQNTSNPTCGKLNKKHTQFIDIDKSENQIEYVIYSYQTPIAWKTKDGWRIVELNYSNTTTKQINKIKSILSQEDTILIS